jgi:hypothetical protein
MTNFLIYPTIGDDHSFPPEVNQAIADSPEVATSFVASDGAGLVPENKLPSRLSAGELSATYVRFTDEAGNPLPARKVVIKVSATTGEIIDIVSEV